MTGRLWHIIERRSVLISLAIGIGLVICTLPLGNAQNGLFDYWYEPKLKAAYPGLYIYPQTRHAVFDAVQIVW